jgi:predicted amidohydrolase
VTREPLVLAVAQPPITAFDVSANVTAHAVLIRAAAARVVVFPEMSLTGYELDAAALDPGDPRLGPLVDVCALTGTTVLAGAPVDGPYIGVLAIDGSGVTVAYRKMYPGGGEPERFRAGTDPAVVEVDGWRIGLAVCRDTGIVAQAAATAELGMDVYAAGLADHPHEDVIQEERARRVAADHGVWVAFASFAGPTGGGYDETAGRSGIWAPTGDLVERTGREPGGLARATLTD